ncbi:hypothetical protein [Terribacillus halophilus]|jgi:hypothetical protein|uniref:hypothetical protein n=1 Tax=Terribacillus halophilus TaxID=361279 RepID=UPI000985D0E4|nr:hypothetical protein [Terribacillus halophilus]
MSEFSIQESIVLIPEEDFSHKKSVLKRKIDEIQDEDQIFYKLANNVLVGEDQKGKVIDAMKDITTKRSSRDTGINERSLEKIPTIVRNFSNQVADMKTQSATITFKEVASLYD